MEPPRIFESAAIKAIVALAQKVGPTDIPVLIAGETGSGKEIIAELIHAHSPRRAKEMVCVNCAGLPPDLVESELFGSIKGAFTGSTAERMGLVKYANGSTLFLDELSEMPLGLQSKLLRFIQDRQVRRVGGVAAELVDTRIIAAVNKDPRLCIAEHRLREDLYYRLSTLTLTVPPLRHRPEDIIPMAKAYLTFFSEQFKRLTPVMSPVIEDLLRGYHWPGNVRQLLNEMNRCALLCNGKINVGDLNIEPDAVASASDKSVGGLALGEAKTILEMLAATRYNCNAACSRLGISRGTLYAKIKKYGITMPAKRARVAQRSPHHSAHAAPSSAPPLSPKPARPSPRSAEPPAEPPASGFAGLQGEAFLD